MINIFACVSAVYTLAHWSV